MKKTLNFLIALLVMGCQNKKNKEEQIKLFPVIEKNISSDILLNDSESFTGNPYCNYPKHTYLLFTGNHDELLAFVKSMNLFSFTKDSVYSKFLLNEYSGEKLWDAWPYRHYSKDTLVRQKWGIFNVSQASYAGYFNSSKEQVYDNARNNWNGKIIGILKNDTCILFIEELKDPQFKRYNQE